MEKIVILPESCRHRSLQHVYQLLRISVTLTILILLSGCALFQSDSDYNLEKQIERQNIQRELISTQDLQEKRTATEYEVLGDRYVLKGDINRAYIYYVKGLGLEPDNVSIIHKQGTLLLKKSKFVQAEAVYEKLIGINSKDSIALESCGKAYFGQRKFSEAEQSFLAALEINPKLYQSHEFLGLMNSRRQEYDQAIHRFKAALLHQPRNTSITNNLAVTYYLNGDFSKAVHLFKGLAKTSNNQKIHNNLALAYFQLGHYEEAIFSFKQGSESDAVAYNNMGYEFLTHKKYKKAIHAFEKAITLHPKFYPSAQKNLAIAQYELSNGGTEARN